MFGFGAEEMRVLKALNTPAKIQDFLQTLRTNFDYDTDTCMSPRMVLQMRRAHCIEGAMLAAAALRIHGHKPLVVDMDAAAFDECHVVAVFRQNGYWGAISKSNHAVLRYREPVYKSIRELVMSYFHEYFDNAGRRSLRSYSLPVNLSCFDSRGWMTAEKDIWYIPHYLAKIPHVPIVTRSHIARFRKPDPIEIQVGKIVEWTR
ncbi:MAG: hypothetical protein HY514_01180 [Candidatus Aenigmarchaeota archaeon]|nr:hypothetical protein [Candidatus Aenigmarchaeota archaeon]